MSTGRATVSRRAWTLLLVSVATFMLLLDVSVVTTALPTIRADLNASFSDVQWALDAYTLPLAALLLPAASLADITGRKRIFLTGLVIFTLASAACAASSTPLALDISRAVQGGGGALLFATALPLLGQEFRGPERAAAIGIWSAVLAASVAVGPLVGGALVDSLGWQWIFLVNLPIGAFALVAAALTLAESRDPAGRRVDLPGTVLLGLGLFGLVLGIVRGNSAGWTSGLVLGALVGGVLLLVAFVLVEARSARPMLDLTLFRSRSFTGAVLVGFLVSAGIIGMFAYVVILTQAGWGYSAFRSGLSFLPLSVLSFLAAAVTGGRLLGRVSTRVLLAASMAISVLGILLIAVVGWTESYPSTVAGLVVTGFGFGMSTPIIATVGLAAVRPERAGMATGAVNTARQVGVAVGVAGLGAIFESRVRSGVIDALSAQTGPAAARELGAAIAAGGTRQALAAVPPALRPALSDAALTALADGLTWVLVVSAGTVLLAALAALFLVRDAPTHAPAPDEPLAAAAA
jgi:EmrB/QacA subfamily drug resistance transporter